MQSLDQFPAVVALRRLRRLTDISRPIVKYSKDVVHYSSNLPLTAIPQVTAKIGNAAHIAEGNQRIEEEQSEETPLPTLFCKVIRETDHAQPRRHNLNIQANYRTVVTKV